ncbi:TlpA disulfide reductase family protein [Emticicia sp. BO119]|uniref:TlpA family protein disulfide reductase n=1 Tax=Emticicia sp. BO119 TaxID=2757768 RepID=UPI0015F048A6|nr:TlpA disulfide reductase family protein [Emticicia sp. BO119]MBA4852287.1 TlpA family protein disulfide reductase [Emticicia sp. BO119]
MRLITFLCVLITVCANTFAQSKKVQVKLVSHPGVNKKNLSIMYDNGLAFQRVVLSKNDASNEEMIETESYTSYLRITIVGLYKEEIFDNNEDFYISSESGRIDFFKNPNRKDNLKYKLLLNGILDDIGQKNHKNAIRKEVNEMAAIRQNPTLATDESLRKIYNDKAILIQRIEQNLVKTHSDSFYYQEMFYKKIGMWNADFTEKELRDFYVSNFDEKFRKSVYGKRIAETIADLELDEGSIAPAISQKALNGRIVDLSNFKNHYVLIDFWATDCKPCIQKLPVIQTIADKYKNKGLVTILISSDIDEDDWKNFIIEHNLDMIHIRDSEETLGIFWKITYIPQTFLIDKEGKIIYSAKASKDDNLEKLKNILEGI